MPHQFARVACMSTVSQFVQINTKRCSAGIKLPPPRGPNIYSDHLRNTNLSERQRQVENGAKNLGTWRLCPLLTHGCKCFHAETFGVSNKTDVTTVRAGTCFATSLLAGRIVCVTTRDGLCPILYPTVPLVRCAQAPYWFEHRGLRRTCSKRCACSAQ